MRRTESHSWRRQPLIWAAAIFFGLISLSCPQAKPLDAPDTILSAIQDRGARNIVAEMNRGKGRVWDKVLDKIETGDRKWLEVAASLREGTDAGTSEGLSIAVAHALLHAPERVLAMTPGLFQLDDICTMPDIEPPLPLYRSYILKAKTALAGVHQAELREVRDRCVEAFDALPPSP